MNQTIKNSGRVSAGFRPRPERVALYPSRPLLGRARRPVTLGIPWPTGVVRDIGDLGLLGPDGGRVPAQMNPLARWPDGSIKWLLLDSVIEPSGSADEVWSVVSDLAPEAPVAPLSVTAVEGSQAFRVRSGTGEFWVGPGGLQRAILNGRDLMEAGSCRILKTDLDGRTSTPVFDRITADSDGPVRATLRLEGEFPGRSGCRVVLRLCFFEGTGLVRARLTLHNPRRARHRGGIWDLGDRGSVLFRDISMAVSLAGGPESLITWTVEAGRGTPSRAGGPLEIYQDSSGGENWRSRNHLNRLGQVPCHFQGYRVRASDQEERGLRASPVVAVQGGVGSISAAVPEFWQQFPKALEAEGTTIRIRLFPGRFGDPFELQGGEQKTHTVWFDFGPTEGDPSESLAWVHEPGRLVVSPEWYSESGVVPHLVPAEPGGRLEEEMAKAIDGPRSLFTRRETIDEYGWRNFGDVHADHEGAYFQGEPPVISHYNNQYDLLLGMILQHARSGDGRWFELLEPLARHVCDIDIYHTDRDKSAYNGGLFWHTEHYRTAETSTHRTFSRANKPADGRPYGGGPSAEHNYTTGLLYYYYLTGDEIARETVEGLADWAMKADDGQRTIFGLVDRSPTGFSSRTAEWSYHGPGRGCGNSVNALIDGWLLTGRRSYLRMAESLIGRCIHPADRIEERDLLSTELRWSYTVFLSVLDRYLSVKAEAGERDRMYAYAQASLLHYATWMLENEVPYFDRPEQLEYPTETWAAQELRKGNVLRLASAHADEPLRSRLKARGDELADRAWSDLLRFESRDVARALAILMREGTVDAYCRSRPIVPAPRPEGDADFGAPVVFVAQKDHVRSLLKSPTGMLRATWRIALSLARNPRLLTEGPQ